MEKELNLLEYLKENYSIADFAQMAIDEGYGPDICTSVYIDPGTLELYIESFSGNTYSNREGVLLYQIDQFGYKWDFTSPEDLFSGEEIKKLSDFCRSEGEDNSFGTWKEIADDEALSEKAGIEWKDVKTRTDEYFLFWAAEDENYRWEDIANQISEKERTYY